MLDSSLQPAQISAEESQLLAGMNTKEVFGWVMGKLAEDDELLTVAVADYGRRLNLDRFRELRHDEVTCGACGRCRWLRIRSYRPISHGGGGYRGYQDHPGTFRVQSG